VGQHNMPLSPRLCRGVEPIIRWVN
jgi:hypothetical protein